LRDAPDSLPKIRHVGILASVKKLLASIEDVRVRSSLAAATADGGLWALMYGFSEYFILPFAIYFGANAFQTSLVQGMGQLGVAVAQLLGAALIARFGKRKRLSRVCVGIHALSWLAVFWMAALTKSPWIVVAFYAMGVFVSSIASPGWLSWMNDLVPTSIRGAYWGKRYMVVGIVQFAAITLAGLALHFAEPRGLTLVVFGVLFTLAAIARGGGVVAIGYQYETPMERDPEEGKQGFLSFLASLPHGNLGRFVLFSVLTTFAINLMGPLLSLYLLKSLKLGYFEYTAVTMVSMALSYLAMNYWGPLADRYGNRSILLATAGALPIVAFGWVFAKTLPAMLGLQVLSGFVLAGFNLSTTNFIFDSVDGPKVASTMANFNALNNTCAFAGSISGGIIATALAGLNLPFFAAGNYELVFVVSGLLRLVIFIALARGFTEVRPVEPSPSPSQFYFYQPFTQIIYQPFVRIIDRVQSLVDEAREGGHDDKGA
jgi:MFS family permease